MWNSRSGIFNLQPPLFKVIYIDTYMEFHIWNLYLTTTFIQGDIYIDTYMKFQIWNLYLTTISIQGDI